MTSSEMEARAGLAMGEQFAGQVRAENSDFTAEKYVASEFLDDDPRVASTRAAEAHRHSLEGHLETSRYKMQPPVVMEEGKAYDTR